MEQNPNNDRKTDEAQDNATQYGFASAAFEPIAEGTMDRSSRMLFLGPAGATLAGLFVAVLTLGRLAKSHGPLLPAHDHAGHDHIAAKLNATSAETGTTFYAEVARVNKRMHEAMEIAPTGDADCDFTKNLIADQNFEIFSLCIDETNRSTHTVRQGAMLSIGNAARLRFTP